MGVGWRRERCLLAAGVVLARAVTVERRLEHAMAHLPVEALAEHPLWDYLTVYASPGDGVPGVIDAGCRAALIADLDRVDAGHRRLGTAVQRLQLICDQAVSDAADDIVEDAEAAWSVVEAGRSRSAAADAVERLWWGRAQLTAAVRAELGLPPLTGQPAASDPDAGNPR
jgi:hypothetical protein